MDARSRPECAGSRSTAATDHTTARPGRALRILLSSHAFAPSIGGLETVSQSLAEEFVRQGHEVRVITQTLADVVHPDATRSTYRIWRRPSPLQLLSLVRWCEIYFHNNISLPRTWPLTLVRRPWVVAHHVWIPRGGMGRLKRLALRHASGISVSHAIASDLATPSVVIPNPYDDATFRRLPAIERAKDLIFVGRLVSDKGVHLLIEALAQLRSRGLRPSLTIVGKGPEEASLRAQAQAAHVATQVSFVGWHGKAELARLLNEHRLIVVPSLWQEPFGIVALEGIACGCVAVGSEGGGLRDAIGPCGRTFPNGDAAALAATLEPLLREPQGLDALRAGAEQHLRRHRLDRVAAEYLSVFTGCLDTQSPERGAADAG
jgi:glycogen synthase